MKLLTILFLMDHLVYITATMMYYNLAEYSITFGLIKLFYDCYKLTRYRYLIINILLYEAILTRYGLRCDI